jgi:hypothetical protein
MRSIYWFLIAFLTLFAPSIHAQNCYETNITAPTPFLGNNNEIFKTGDGGIWQVKYAYEYLYEYYPTVLICSESKLVLKGKTIDIIKVGQGGASGGGRSAPTSNIKVILKPRGCRSYFLADGDSGGVYLLEWYGGYDPAVGDSLVGDIRSYGFKEVFYPEKNAQGKVYVDDYMLSRSRAIEKLREKCN